MNKISDLFEKILCVFFPKQCACCDVLISEKSLVCDDCSKNLLYIEDPICTKCGQSKNNCECKLVDFYFKGCIAPFFHEGSAKNGIYQFKFDSRTDAAVFWGKEMKKAVIKYFGNIKFDGICFVPMLFKSKFKRGYNQSELLAKIISKELKIPLLRDALIKYKANKIQHNLSRGERFINIQNVFKCDYDVMDKTLLIIDDIKTTGATLNECARTLYNSGALNIYCVTAVLAKYHSCN